MVKDSKKKQTRHTSPSLLCLYLSGPMPLVKIPQLGTMISYQRSFHT
ncbi:hypothetical protein NC652_040707 [Populus alba x Populus x berolinensis]|nr:hypothetical protein NC652_040707 [Populus alba x Populus x berolinensis]